MDTNETPKSLSRAAVAALIITLGLAFGASGGLAQSNTIFANMSSLTDLPFVGEGSNVVTEFSTNFEIAQRFTPTTTGNPTSFSVWVSCLTSPCGGTLKITTDSGGNPGTALVSVPFTYSGSSFGSSATCVALPASPSLQAGTDYWAVMAGGAGVFNWWYQELGSAVVAERNDSGAWSNYNETRRLSVRLVEGECGQEPLCPPDDALDTGVGDDSSANATPVSNGQVFSDMIACDSDYFAISADAGVIEVDISFVDAKGDIDAELFSPSNTVVVSGATGSDNENLTFNVVTPGVYFLRVYPFNSADFRNKNIYDIAFSFEEQRCPPDDVRDDGPGDDTMQTATPIGPGDSFGGYACDDDFFAVELAEGSTFTATATFSDDDGDIDLRLLDPNGDDVAVSTSASDDEAITTSVNAAGTYFLRVYPYTNTDPTTTNVYDLVVDFDRPGEFEILAMPCVVLDTAGINASGPIPANTGQTVTVAGSMPSSQGTNGVACIPAGAASAVINIAAVNPSGVGNLRLSEAGVAPFGGVVNYAANGLDNVNTVTVPLSANGQVDVFANQGSTDVVMAVVAYQMPPGQAVTGDALRYVAVTPCALFDSRTALAGFAGPFSSIGLVQLNLSGPTPSTFGAGSVDCGIPSDAEGILMNVVAVNPTGSGFIDVGDFVENPANARTLHYQGFTPNMNNAVTTVAPLINGVLSQVSVVGGSAHLRLVALGYYVGDAGQSFTPVNPCAAFDTRSNQGGQGPRLGGSTTTFQIGGSNIPAAQGGGSAGDCGIPEWAESVLINLVAVSPSTIGNLRVSAADIQASGGVLNFANLSPAMNNSNAVVVPLSELGAVDVFVNSPQSVGLPVTEVRGVILGYYS